jgi:hypothetical protein
LTVETSPHRVRLQRWIVRAASPEDAFAWRQVLRDEGPDLLSSVLEKAFDEVVRSGKTVRVPKLELTVKLDSREQLREILPLMAVEQLREQLLVLSATETGPGSRKARQSASPRNDRLSALLYYLQTGYLPWWAARSSTEGTDELHHACREDAPEVIASLARARAGPASYFRFLEIISPEDRPAMIEGLSMAISPESRSDVVRVLLALLRREKVGISLRSALASASALLWTSLNEGEGGGTGTLAVSFPEDVPAGERRLIIEVVSSLTGNRAHLFSPAGSWEDETRTEEVTAPPPAETGNGIPAAQRREPTDRTVPEETTEYDQRIDRSSAHRPAGLARQAFTKKSVHAGLPRSQRLDDDGSDTKAFVRRIGREGESAPLAPERSAHQGPGERLFPLTVHQAGLVLLHPFIAPFFEATAVAEAGCAVLPPFETPRAAALLHLLSTGREDVHEHELGLIKVLLGMEAETPLLVCEGLVRSGDRNEAETLLQTVIGYWTVLKSTSVEGFRSSFLERQGILREDEIGWRLTVERAPFDVLLDHLPWSMSVIKLPWMKKVIHTEW